MVFEGVIGMEGGNGCLVFWGLSGVLLGLNRSVGISTFFLPVHLPGFFFTFLFFSAPLILPVTFEVRVALLDQSRRMKFGWPG